MATVNLNVRVDERLKKDAEILFADLGLNMSSAITVFLKSAVDYNGIPFEIRRVNRGNTVSDDEILSVSGKLIEKNKQAYGILAK